MSKERKMPAAAPQSQKIKFYYLKSNLHHVAHIDGAYGSITPQGFVSACLFSERFAIPTETTHTIIGGALKGDPDEIKSKEGIVREIAVTAMLLPVVARQLGEWLIQKANEAERLTMAAANEKEAKK